VNRALTFSRDVDRKRC